MILTTESITFGKYKGFTLGHILKDRQYCKWLLEQEWFQQGYEYLYNRIKDYKPKEYFIKPDLVESGDFLENYSFFNLYDLEDIRLPLSDSEKTCYIYYRELVQKCKDQIYERLENDDSNPYDIKAPTKWLQQFEKEHGIPRVDFKSFLDTYELLNLPYIIERIKKEGGLEYKGAQSFIIAKARSKEQENWWENVLKEKYGEELGTQFKYQNCIFDFLNISTNTIFECKLGLKDFAAEQHTKYKLTLDKYRIIYLIACDCVIDMEKKKLYTSNPEYYQIYLSQVALMKDPSYLDILIEDFTVIYLEDLSTLFGK